MREVPSYEIHEFQPKRHDYCVAVFVINEGEKLARQLERMRFLDSQADVIVADGGSRDGSTDHDRLRQLNVNTLLVKTGPGKLGSQMRMAFDWALNRGYRGVVVIDGNGKDGVEAIPNFIAELRNGCDHVQGSRFIPGGHHENTPRSRLLGLKLLHLPVMRLAGGFPYTDTTNGFRGYSAKFLSDETLGLFRNCFEGYELHYFLALEAARGPFQVKELPVSRVYPPSGKIPTKISPIRGNLNVIDKLFKAADGAYRLPPPRFGYGWKLAAAALLLLLLAGIIGWGAWTNTSGDLALRLNEGLAVRQGLDPYFVWKGEASIGAGLRCDINAPWVYLAMAPLAKLPFEAVRWGYFAFQVLLMGGIAAVLFRLALPRLGLFTALVAALAAMVNPYFKTDLATGNFAILTAAGIAGMIWFLGKGREIPAGICWALVLFKPMTGALLLIPLLWQKRYRTIATAAVLCGGATLTIWALTGSNPLALLLHMKAGGSTYVLEEPHLTGIFAFAANWLTPEIALQASSLFGLGLTLYGTWKLRVEAVEIALLPAIMMALVWNYSRVFNLVLLVFPALLFFGWFFRSRTPREQLTALTGLALLLFPIGNLAPGWLYSTKYAALALLLLAVIRRPQLFRSGR